MSRRFAEYESLDLSRVNEEVLADWMQHRLFEESLKSREGAPSFVFYEGPPSANGMPGIHHVMARAIKDTICRYKTMKGFRVFLGYLPVELGGEGLGRARADGDVEVVVELTDLALLLEIAHRVDGDAAVGHRPVSCYAFFKGWLLLSQPPGCLRDRTSFPT